MEGCKRKAGVEGEIMVAEIISSASKLAGGSDPVIEKLKDTMDLLETRVQELEKHIEAAEILIVHT
jgi:hypothetical protein